MRLSVIRLALIPLLLTATLVACWGETPDEVAQRSRNLLTDPSTFGVGILSTIYPDDYPIKELRGYVTSGSDYFAPCYDNGDLLVLALPVSQNWKNALTSPGKNATFAIISNADPSIPDPRHETSDGKWDPSRPEWRKGMYSKQRLTLFGHLQTLSELQSEDRKVQDCYLSYHPDATHFIPGSKDSPHLAIWTRFIVDKVYRVGGYGDESQIGWLDLRRWQRAGKKMAGKWSRVVSSDARTKAANLKERRKGKASGSNQLNELFGESSAQIESDGLLFQA